jgi:hypothetical protein
MSTLDALTFTTSAEVLTFEGWLPFSAGGFVSLAGWLAQDAASAIAAQNPIAIKCEVFIIRLE